MGCLNEYMVEYKKQIENGVIQKAYRGLMNYFNTLRTLFQKKYPDHSVSGNIYYGFMDMTYFSFTPESLKRRKLKIAIVFLHEEFRFEVWLAASNRAVQRKYWKLFSEYNWEKYNLIKPAKGVDAILTNILTDDPDFFDLDKLTKQIEKDTLEFINDIETFLTQ
jgi:hypothetical protein